MHNSAAIPYRMPAAFEYSKGNINLPAEDVIVLAIPLENKITAIADKAIQTQRNAWDRYDLAKGEQAKVPHITSVAEHQKPVFSSMVKDRPFVIPLTSISRQIALNAMTRKLGLTILLKRTLLASLRHKKYVIPVNRNRKTTIPKAIKPTVL